MDIQKLINDYTQWLKSEITFSKIGEYYEITTPYLDNANDYLQIYVRQDGNDILFSDDSATISNLKATGFQFTPNRKKNLQRILAQFGVNCEEDELTAKAPIQEFAKKKHLFIQAILRVDDMFALSKSKTASLFTDDIQQFFDSRDIFYSDNVQFTGTSGFTHSYDFLFQRTKTQPERLCQAMNNPNKSSVGNILFAWNDTKLVRKNNSQLIVILNDQNNVSRGIEEAFTNYDVKVVPWSQRNASENLALFAAG